MKRQDLLSILITFCVGVLAGFYVYLTGFAVQFSSVGAPEVDLYETFTITGEVYGKCRTEGVCGSFQLLADRSYTYRTFAPSRAEQQVIEGSLSRSMMRELQAVATVDSLESQSVRILPNECFSNNDEANDYRFWITVGGTEYQIDTCGTAYDREGELWQQLIILWTFLYGLQSEV